MNRECKKYRIASILKSLQSIWKYRVSNVKLNIKAVGIIIKESFREAVWDFKGDQVTNRRRNLKDFIYLWFILKIKMLYMLF